MLIRFGTEKFEKSERLAAGHQIFSLRSFFRPLSLLVISIEKVLYDFSEHETDA